MSFIISVCFEGEQEAKIYVSGPDFPAECCLQRRLVWDTGITLPVAGREYLFIYYCFRCQVESQPTLDERPCWGKSSSERLTASSISQLHNGCGAGFAVSPDV